MIVAYTYMKDFPTNGEAMTENEPGGEGRVHRVTEPQVYERKYLSAESTAEKCFLKNFLKHLVPWRDT
jgi:hypothetical protein